VSLLLASLGKHAEHEQKTFLAQAQSAWLGDFLEQAQPA
jgi:hypothetical protein